ncbi:hypothetical protein IBL26_18770 [Roseomonas aerophila]|uniref:Uncharacterized protein n=1 Tax=Teichococcus aerophilus TaxID=1224513 RepID=A0ABR7RS80_9PROT|nr:hypothetical protein [Pseudoroseomonas aerophila]MBC9208897.1 hypothetical protein [Pseudoroseomonas aerophila]
MEMRFPLPLWLLRRLVRRNPWLLSDSGQVTRGRKLDLGFMEVDIDTTLSLNPRRKAQLLARQKGPPAP